MISTFSSTSFVSSRNVQEFRPNQITQISANHTLLHLLKVLIEIGKKKKYSSAYYA